MDYFIKVDELSKNTMYTSSTINKLLTKSAISNHFVLTEDDIIRLYKSTEYKNQKSWSLLNYIEEIMPDIHDKI